MKKLFEIVNGEVVMNASSLWIPEFRKVWNRDKSEYKKVAHNEITYIVFMYDYSSPYMVYNAEEREDKIINDYFQDLPDWEADKLVKDAVKKFREMQETPTLKLLNAVNKSIGVATTFFEKSTEGDMEGIMKYGERIGNLVKSLDGLTKQVEKEMAESSSVRGGQGIGMFEL